MMLDRLMYWLFGYVWPIGASILIVVMVIVEAGRPPQSIGDWLGIVMLVALLGVAVAIVGRSTWTRDEPEAARR